MSHARLPSLALALLLGALAPFPVRAFADDPTTHWAFVPPDRPNVPEVQRREWVRNPIDAFVLRGLEDFDLTPSPEADRATLLRRLHFDLTGLPPTPEELRVFLADDAPDAYERLVDRLLASPRYGERWAQHWLDLARYADSDGFEFDEARPDAWRFRDWVISALNRDLPYDRFLTLQLAGDEAERGDPDAAIATGFNRCYPDMVDLNDQGLRRQNALNDITETTGLVFLGLTVGCARCHDHKSDPITQAEFYRLQAFFTPAEFRDDYPIGEGAKARVVVEDGKAPPPTFLLLRGDYTRKGPGVEPGFPASLGAETPRIVPTESSSGRRSALAAWLARPDHPLTARVMVNRLWQGHFGRGLVASPSDFGVLGEPPTHPELLDWLAVEFVERGWSVKAIHRLIVTSAAYRQSSRQEPDAAEVDPENLLLWRQNRRRLDGEAIRDAMLAASGSLNPAMGGPCVFPDLPGELTKLSSKGKVWPVSPDSRDRARRGLYIFVRRNLRFPFFEVFDRPDTNASCPRRGASIVAPQALTLLNGDLSRAAADGLAARVADDPDPIGLAYRLTLGRPPDDAERRLARGFLDDGGSLGEFALALFNVNEFLSID